MKFWLPYIIVFIFACLKGNSQVENTFTLGGKWDESISDLFESFDGNLLIVGQSQSPNIVGKHGWVVKMNEQGEELFKINIPGEGDYKATKVVEDANGMMYVGVIGHKQATKGGEESYEAWLECYNINRHRLWRIPVQKSKQPLKFDGLIYDEVQDQLVLSGIKENSIWLMSIGRNSDLIEEKYLNKNADLYDLTPESTKLIQVNQHYFLAGKLKHSTRKYQLFVAKLDKEIDLLKIETYINEKGKIKEVNALRYLKSGNLAVIGTTMDKDENMYFFRTDTMLRKGKLYAIEENLDQRGMDIIALTKDSLLLLGYGQKKRAASNDIILHTINEAGLVDSSLLIDDEVELKANNLLLKRNGSIWIGGVKNMKGTKEDIYISQWSKSIQQPKTVNPALVKLRAFKSGDTKLVKVHENAQSYNLKYIVQNESNTKLTDLILKIACITCQEGVTVEQKPVGNLAAESIKKITIPIFTTQKVIAGNNRISLTLQDVNGEIFGQSEIQFTTYQRQPFELIDYTFNGNPSTDTLEKGQTHLLSVRLLNKYFETSENDEVFFPFVSGLNNSPDIFPLKKTQPGDTLTIPYHFIIHSFFDQDSFNFKGQINLVDRDLFEFAIKGKVKKEIVFTPTAINVPKPSMIQTIPRLRKKGIEKELEMDIDWGRDMNTESAASTSTQRYEIQFDVNSNFIPIEENFYVQINGEINKIQGIKADEVTIKRRPRPGKKDKLFVSFKVPLQPGYNTIEVAYQDNSFLAQTSRPIGVKCNYSDKGTLYAICIGVPDAGNILNYTANDAADFAHLIQQQQDNGVFDSVEVHLLNTVETTKATHISSIIQEKIGLPASRNTISKKDGVIIFMSSHGSVTELGEFRIHASDYNQGFPDVTSINFQYIQDVLDEVDCQKWVFIDACHSGTVKNMMQGIKGSEEEEFSFARIINKRLAAATGIRALASCEAKESSHEDKIWKNGAMTEALVTLLDDKDRCKEMDTNKNGALTLSEIFRELKKNVEDIVQKVRKKKQTPYYTIPDSMEEDVDLFAY